VKPSIGNRSNDWGKRAQSDTTSSASGNHRLADNDACRQITQNCHLRECGRDREDLRNIIDDRRRLKARSLTSPRCSLARDVTPSGRGGFRALAPSLRQVVWPKKFKFEHIDKYGRSNNPDEFIRVYHTVVEAVGGDN
jgi:hypothetical protein